MKSANFRAEGDLISTTLTFWQVSGDTRAKFTITDKLFLNSVGKEKRCATKNFNRWQELTIDGGRWPLKAQKQTATLKKEFVARSPRVYCCGEFYGKPVAPIK